MDLWREEPAQVGEDEGKTGRAVTVPRAASVYGSLLLQRLSTICNKRSFFTDNLRELLP